MCAAKRGAREVRGLAAAGGGFSVGLSLLGVVVCTASVFFSSWQGFSVFVWFWTITWARGGLLEHVHQGLPVVLLNPFAPLVSLE